jgi:hypothetical protein
MLVLFEDHTVDRFRPLSWSWPLYELRCGILNLRERVQLLQRQVHDQTGMVALPLGLLPRTLLAPLHHLPDAAVGPDAVRQAAQQAEGWLCLHGRLGPRLDVIAALFRASDEPGNFVWRDELGPVAWSLGADQGPAWLAAWEAGAAIAHQPAHRHDPTLRLPPWPEPDAVATWPNSQLPLASHRWQAEAPHAEIPADLTAALASADQTTPAVFSAIWDLIPAVGATIQADVAATVASGMSLQRELWGVTSLAGHEVATGVWTGDELFAQVVSPAGDSSAPRSVAVPAGSATPPAARNNPHCEHPEQIWLAPGVRVSPTAVLDASSGPIVLDRNVEVMPHSYLIGPLYVGPGSLVKAGSCLGGDTSIGAVCKVAGEVAETTMFDFSNKQHDGFLGHSVIGSWVNLGAGTTNSDLKNNYGSIRVDLGFGQEETGRQFLGLLMGDHSKTAIGTLINTGSCIGFSCNVFAAGFPPKYLPNFSWGAGDGATYTVAKAMQTARIVMKRRGCAFTPAHEALFLALAGQDS